VRGAVFDPLGAVGRYPFGGTRQSALLIAQRSLEAVAEHVKSGAVLVCGDGIGHGVPFEGL
jgi:hypothetical protein